MESGRHGQLTLLTIVRRLEFGRRHVADRFEQTAMVEPVDPFQRCASDGLRAAPRPAMMDDLGAVLADDVLGEGVVVRIAVAADRWLGADFGQPFGVANRPARRRQWPWPWPPPGFTAPIRCSESPWRWLCRCSSITSIIVELTNSPNNRMARLTDMPDRTIRA